MQLGSVSLLLLDAELPENDPVSRWTTARLYDGNTHIRLAQYGLLGIGGARVLDALDIRPDVVHLNEGHPALAALERGRPARRAAATPLEEALERVRKHVVFTTHTPLQAGNESYPPEQFFEAFEELAGRLGLGREAFIDLCRVTAGEDEPGMSPLAMRLSSRRNGVSERHGELAREMWQPMFPDAPVPIDHVTNGAHLATFLGDPFYALLHQHLGEHWRESPADPRAWEPVRDIPNAELWARADGCAAAPGRVRPGEGRAGPAAPRRGARLRPRRRRPARRRHAHVRLRAQARGLQAALAARGRHRARAPPAHGADADPGPDRGQGAPARPRREAAARAAVRAPRRDRPAGRAGRLPRGLRPRPRPPARLGLRRLGQPAPPAARGQRDERDEGDVQRLPPPERARRLVGRGLQRPQRLGDQGRPEPRPVAGRRRGRRRALHAARGRGDPALLRPRRRRGAAALVRDDQGGARELRPAVHLGADARRLRDAHLPAGRPGGAGVLRAATG